MNRFEQLIEYVINDEDKKAQELFHDIVVAKSREIYENMMDEELDEELDEAEDVEEGAMGGDAADSLIDDVEMEEESDINMEGEGHEEDANMESMHGYMEDDMDDKDMDDMDSEPATKDDIMNLEDKLDQLMADFENLMADGNNNMGDGDMMGPEEGGDAIEIDDTEEMDNQMGMMEALQLKAAPKPVTSEEGNTNKKSTVAANSGARGAMAKPVHITGETAQGRPAPSAKDMGGTTSPKQAPAPKPTIAQASGVNTKSPLPGSRG